VKLLKKAHQGKFPLANNLLTMVNPKSRCWMDYPSNNPISTFSFWPLQVQDLKEAF
jgi:hypothetical protein